MYVANYIQPESSRIKTEINAKEIAYDNILYRNRIIKQRLFHLEWYKRHLCIDNHHQFSPLHPPPRKQLPTKVLNPNYQNVRESDLCNALRGHYRRSSDRLRHPSVELPRPPGTTWRHEPLPEH